VGFLLFSVASGYAFGEEAPSPYLSDRELAELVALLDDVQDELMGRISGLTEEQWSFKQNPDRWSVGECVEHIARSEAALLGRIEELVAGPADPEWYSRTYGKLAVLRQYVPNRGPQGQGGRQAPEEIRPTEHWGRGRAIAELYATHGRVRAFVETMDRDIKSRTMESSVPAFGWLNAHDWLNSLALHVVRHTKQIVEVQEDPNYPAKPAATAAAAATEPDPRVTDEELGRLVKEIDDAQDLLLSRISNITDEQWTFEQNPNRWSIGECVEHIARAQRAILDGVVYSLAGPPNPEWFEQTKGKLELVYQNVLTRTPGGVGSPFRAPYEVSPTEQWDRARGLQEFYASHGRLRALVESMPREIKNRTFMNPFPQIGMLNAHDWLTLATLHVVRHTKQIIEVQEDPSYPGKPASTGAE
jgi:uncharacterized damage-inducible protein DinB